MCYIGIVRYHFQYRFWVGKIDHGLEGGLSVRTGSGCGAGPSVAGKTSASNVEIQIGQRWYVLLDHSFTYNKTVLIRFNKFYVAYNNWTLNFLLKIFKEDPVDKRNTLTGSGAF